MRSSAPSHRENEDLPRLGHVSVLLPEVLQALELQVQGRYLDATFGRGGHSRAILQALSPAGALYALDRDPEAAREAMTWSAPNFHFAAAPFSELGRVFGLAPATLDGVLFDLGVSSPQLDDPRRGFSFRFEAPLDMRMDNRSGETAAEWLARVDEATLASVIRDYGGETHSIAKRLARAIMAARAKIQTTTALAEVVAAAMPAKYHRAGYHPATQTFQALRIAVNDEMGELERALAAATELLRPGGVLAVITFHGLEDATVKRFFRQEGGQALPKEIPTAATRMGQTLREIKPVLRPSALEIELNPRARSARLRKAVKL